MAILKFNFTTPISGIQKVGVLVDPIISINVETGVCQGKWYDIIVDPADPAYPAPGGAADYRTPKYFTIALTEADIGAMMAPVVPRAIEQGVLRESIPELGT